MSYVILRSTGDASVEPLFFSQQLFPQRVALQDALQCWRVVARHLLLHMKDGDVGWDTEVTACQHLQERRLPQTITTYQTVTPA